MATKFAPKEKDFNSLTEDIRRGDMKFKIPGFQREYSWKNTDDVGCKPFVSDLFNLMDHKQGQNKQPHFFNSLIYIETPQDNDVVYEIIDGQQRITSLILLNAAMATLFNYKFEIDDNTLKSEKEREKRAPVKRKKDSVSIHDIFKNSKVLGFTSKDPNIHVHTFLADSFVYIKKEIDYDKITKFLFEDHFENLVYSKQKYFEKYKNCDDQDEALSKFKADQEGLRKKKNIDHNDKCSIIQSVISFIVSRNIKGDKLAENKLIKDGILLIKDKPTNAKSEPKDIIKIFDEVTQFYRIIDLNKNKDSIEIKSGKVHRYFDNYYFFLEAIQDQYNSFVREIYSKEAYTDDKSKKEFSKQDNNLPLFFIFHYDGCLRRSKFIEIIISDPSNPTFALEAALSAFASINSSGQKLTSFEVIYSKIYSNLNNEDVSKGWYDDFKKFSINEPLNKLSRGVFLTKNLDEDEILKFFFAKHKSKYVKTRLVSLYDEYIEKNSCKAFCNSVLRFMRKIQGIDNGFIREDDDWKYSSALNSLGMHARDNKTLISIILHISELKIEFNEKVEIFSLLHFNFLKYSILYGSKNFVGNFEKMMENTNPDTLILLIKELFKSNEGEIKLRVNDLNRNYYNLKSITKDILLLNESRARIKGATTKVESNLLQPKYTIEHILPQSYHKGSTLTSDQFKRLCNSLSNLTLLTKSDNSKAADKEITDKMYYFLVGGLQINKELVDEIKKEYNKNKNPKEKFKEATRVTNTKGKKELKVVNVRGDIITDKINDSFIKENWLFGSFDKDYENITTASTYLNDKIELLFDYVKFKEYHDFIDSDDQFENHRKAIYQVEMDTKEFVFTEVK